MDQTVRPSISTTGLVRSKSDDRPTRLDRFSALTVLVAFGITWPVLQLLANNAEFFLARDSSKWEILGLALVLAIGLPVTVGLLGALPGRFGEWLGDALILVTASILGLLVVRDLEMPTWVTLGSGLVFGMLVTWAIHRLAIARQISRYLLGVPIVLLIVFTFATPAGAMLRDQGVGIGAPVAVRNPVPIVFLVLDEFPVASIIDPEGNLREERYPNLARLASDGAWFRNAVTVEQQTEHSVPAILTGRVPDQSLTPFAGHYPDSLFTALHNAYDLRVNETITSLCPSRLCERQPTSPAPLTSDVLAIAGRVLLPEPLANGLPEIDSTWGDFGYVPDDFDVVEEFREHLNTDRRDQITDLADDIRGYQGARPPLFFLHAVIPHHPWEFLPDGRRYPLVVSANPASLGGGWIEDEFLVAQGMQRHLLQVGYADHAIGELITAMEDAGIYDDAIMVIVADHGIAIKPGVAHQRTITPTTVGEIAAIPLFIKAPGLEPGTIEDRRALTIDILPTIADAIDARIPWKVEGVSLIGPEPDRAQTTTVGPKGEVTYGVDGLEKLEVARRIEDWFPDGDPWALRPSGSPDLLGKVIDVATLEKATVTGQLRMPELYAAVGTAEDMIPVRVAGRLRGGADGSEVVAVVVNGVVGSITRSYLIDDEVWFLAMVPPHPFVDGKNAIDLVEVMPDGELRRIPEA
ncbi:MAG TPA: sulfatase-like hydrolase/transferase [Acidimicrobiia bacterium]